MRPDRLLELAETILERATLTIMFQRRGTVEFLRLPADHEKERVGQQVQLSGLRVGLIDDYQQQTLRMFPRLGLIAAEFDDVFITTFGRPSHGPPQMRRRESVEGGIALQSPDKTQFFVGQIVQRLTVGVAGVDAKVEHMAQPLGFANCLLQKPLHAVRRMNLTLPQDRVQETVSQAVSLLHAVVVAGYRVTGHQRMIDRILVVTVVGGAGLPTMPDDRKAIDSDGDLSRGVVVVFSELAAAALSGGIPT